MSRGHAPDPRRIRILFLIKVLAPGGAEQLLLTHLRLIDRSRFETHVAHVFDTGGDFAAEIRRSCDSTHRLSRRNDPRSHGAIGLVRLLLANRYDIVHIHSPVLGSIARVILRLRPRRRRPRIVTTEHLVWDGYHPATRAFNRCTVRGDDWIFAVSRSVEESIDVPRGDRVQLLVHGVELGRFAADPTSRERVRGSLGTNEHTLVIGCIANFRAQKNHALLIRIVEELSRRGADVLCVLVGGGSLEGEIREQVREAGLEGMIRFLGVRDDIPDLLAAIDVLVLTSLWEGLPVVVMEALASGRPVVASDVDGVHDALASSGAARLFDPSEESVPAVCDVLEALQRDPRQRAEMGREALALAATFDATRATKAMCERYLTLLGRGTADLV